jgi:hypothetical protein
MIVKNYPTMCKEKKFLVDVQNNIMCKEKPNYFMISYYLFLEKKKKTISSHLINQNKKKNEIIKKKLKRLKWKSMEVILLSY